MGWKRLDFGGDALARKLPDAVTEGFTVAFAAAGAPGNAALFEFHDDAGLHYYFSPGAAALFENTLSTLGPRAGSAPPPGARLLVGNADTWAKK